jgi:putative spermidine/putrescine transport system ATP-binding protein
MAFLELRDIRKSFGAATAVDTFNLQVERGEFISFLGPSGCGKTTTLRMIAGFEQPTAGQLLVNEQDITRRPPNQRNVGMVFQSYALFPNMNVAQNIAFGMTLKRAPKATITQRVSELLALIGLPGLERRYPYQLSGGQQQRVALARALAIEPQVLLLDEPLSALDAKIRVSLRNEIRSIQRKLGITTIYVTHDPEEALSLSDRIVVMNHGRIEQIGTPFQIYNFPQTAFVASFVGTLNVLQARVRNPASGELEIDGQPLTLARPLTDQRTGDTVAIALRPEVIALDGAAGTANRLRGVVEDVTFLGAIVRVRVQVGTEIVNFDMFNNPSLRVPERGQPVTLAFPVESSLLLDDTAEHAKQAVAAAAEAT